MIELHPHTMAHGGEAVARHDGKAHFVAGAMPGEVVTGTVVEDKGAWARVALVEVLAPAPQRRTEPCIHAPICGGCQWQFAEDGVQREWKHATVVSQLEHLGRIESPLVHTTRFVPGGSFAYRNRIDFHVLGGRPALYRARSNELVPITDCLVLAPPLRIAVDTIGDLNGVTRLTVRCGIRTGDTVAVIEGSVPDDVATWGISVVHVDRGRLRPVAGDPALTETIDNVNFDIPPEGFFQNNTLGAELLVELVRDILQVTPEETMLDAYCGVGLFGATVGRGAGRVIGMDTSQRAVSFARRNLAAAGVDASVIAGSLTRDIERLEEYWDVAVVDPPRKGLGERGVAAVTSALPRRIAYVSCDPASFARDTRTLTDVGYKFVEATPVDLFPQTYHVEIVGRFDRAGSSV